MPGVGQSDLEMGTDSLGRRQGLEGEAQQHGVRPQWPTRKERLQESGALSLEFSHSHASLCRSLWVACRSYTPDPCHTQCPSARVANALQPFGAAQIPVELVMKTRILSSQGTLAWGQKVTLGVHTQLAQPCVTRHPPEGHEERGSAAAQGSRDGTCNRKLLSRGPVCFRSEQPLPPTWGAPSLSGERSRALPGWGASEVTGPTGLLPSGAHAERVSSEEARWL